MYPNLTNVAKQTGHESAAALIDWLEETAAADPQGVALFLDDLGHMVANGGEVEEWLMSHYLKSTMMERYQPSDEEE